MFNIEFWFLDIGLEPGFVEPLQDFIDMLLVFQFILRINYNII